MWITSGWITSGLPTNGTRVPVTNNDPSLKESACLEDPSRPTKTHGSVTGMCPRCFSTCSALVSADLIQLCCREAVSRNLDKVVAFT